MKKSRIMNRMFDVIVRRYHKNLKAGVRRIAQDSWSTNMQQRILNKLHFIAFGKLKAKFDTWKMAIPAIANAIDHKKAKVIDLLIQHSMSDEHRALLRWCKVAMALKV